MNYQAINNPHNPLFRRSYSEVKELLKRNSFFIQFVQNQTEELCLIAVTSNAECFQFIDQQSQTEELCRLAVSLNADAIEYVSDKFIHLFKHMTPKYQYGLDN